jgi:hypothetical protein
MIRDKFFEIFQKKKFLDFGVFQKPELLLVDWLDFLSKSGFIVT